MSARLRPPSSSVLLLLAVALLAALTPPAAAVAQDPDEVEPSGEVTLVLEGDQRPLLRLAFPEMERAEPLSAPGREAAEILDQIVRNDLDAARIFQIQGPWAFGVLELTGEQSRDFEQYRSLGNELVLLARISEQPGKILFEGRVFDLASGQLILGKRYRGDYDVARRVAHTFADEVILYFTGHRGLGLTTIAFHSDRTRNKEIFLMDADGANQRQVTAHNSTSLFPTFATATGSLAYVTFVEGRPGIYHADLASGRKRALVTEGQFNSSPAFSPDGRRMAFTRSLEGNAEIFVADANGGNPRRLTHSNAIDTNPAWSPTGGEIAFTSSRGGNPEVWVMDSDGSNLQKVSTGGSYNDGAAWTPDGTRLIYASRRGGVFQLVMTDRGTRESAVLTSGGGDKESPSVSPDGTRIVYALALGGRAGKQSQIWVMDIDGRNPRQLTREGNNYSPAWSGYPD